MSGPRSRLVVVGAEGFRESEAAFRFAADEAKFRGAVLRIICAWEPGYERSARRGESAVLESCGDRRIVLREHVLRKP